MYLISYSNLILKNWVFHWHAIKTQQFHLETNRFVLKLNILFLQFLAGLIFKYSHLGFCTINYKDHWLESYFVMYVFELVERKKEKLCKKDTLPYNVYHWEHS